MYAPGDDVLGDTSSQPADPACVVSVHRLGVCGLGRGLLRRGRHGWIVGIEPVLPSSEGADNMPSNVVPVCLLTNQ
jgi:hypothetical protein